MPESNTPVPGDAAPSRKNSPQDKAIEAYITDSEVFLNTAGTDPEILPLLEARGYDAAEFAEGGTLASAARAAFEARASAMGRQSSTTGGLGASIRAVRDEYARFRVIARASFSERADRLALSLTGDVPEDTGRFITTAIASYQSAGKVPYAEKFAKRGYAAAILGARISELNALTATVADQDQAQGGAVTDTAARDAAYDALRVFIKELKGVAKGALRGKPGLLAKLGL